MVCEIINKRILRACRRVSARLTPSRTTLPTDTTTMPSVAVVAIALLETVAAFSAPAMLAPKSLRSASATMFEEGDIGVLPPLGTHRT